ncbi:uncharacterized protein LOC122035071 isoform X3 [Zingiber officinale]|uniref:uncharacterized protein LOC122035071 isoform X3 n=1 Tax=Zingiber officinale TaxID=94328 RepID=UPI001C4D41F4|nr:uncharacterized protein LOC122035071 isoform X3 [Zingiber officinale]
MNRLKKEHMRDSSSRNSSSSNDTRRPSNYSRTSGDMNRFKKEHMRDSSSRNSSSSNDTRTPSNYSRTSFLHTLLLCKRHDGGFLLSKLQLFKRHEKAKQLQQDIIHDGGFLLSKLQLFEPHKSTKKLQRDEVVKFSRFSFGKQEQDARGLCKGF